MVRILHRQEEATHLINLPWSSIWTTQLQLEHLTTRSMRLKNSQPFIWLGMEKVIQGIDHHLTCLILVFPVASILRNSKKRNTVWNQ